MRFNTYATGNTCKIKLLKRAHVGVSVRMTSDKSTLPFENVPMKGMVIENYNKQGFFISHDNLPKKVWVDFDQLPLTRLKINNGVIEDEITFVENIVNHRMQLIRTLDTEYIDLLYKEKELDELEKKNNIISLSEAVPGHWYKGAQCKEGTEMIYLGTWHGGILEKSGYYNNKKYYVSKKTPKRAFFLMLSDTLGPEEEREIKKKWCPWLNLSYNNHHGFWKERREAERVRGYEAVQKELDEEKKVFENVKREYLSKNVSRYKMINYAFTSKVVKELIILDKEPVKDFNDTQKNKELCQYFPHKNRRYIEFTYNGTRPKTEGYLIVDYGYDFPLYLGDNRDDVKRNFRRVLSEQYNIKTEIKYFEDR